MRLIKTELNANSLTIEETLFHVANGYLGIRGSLEEGCPDSVPTVRGSYINGFYDTIRVNYHEKLFGFPETAQRLVNLPDVQTMRLFLDGEQFSPFHGELINYERALDTDAGVSKRHMLWRGNSGKTITLDIQRMASFSRPELFLTVYTVSGVDFEGELEIISGVNCAVSNFVDPSDPRVASEHGRHIFFEGAELLNGTALVRCRTGASHLGLSICQSHKLSSEGRLYSKITDSGVETRITAHLKAGGSFRVEKYTLISDSRRQRDPSAHALKTAEDCVAIGGDALLKEQTEFLDKFWRNSRAEIYGCPEIRDAMAFNIFELLQSTGRDAIGSVASKGLSGEGYEGHYFWDTEIYIFPFFLFTQPEIARSLLDFRYHTLEGAKNHARVMGHKKGALYPWRTIAGSECSSFFPAGSAQYHIAGDVAHSFMQYYYATGDLGYIAEKGAEVLIETARLWLDAGNYDANGRFHIHDVTGPDEYTCIVSDNYYTNRCAQYNLRGAAEIYALLKNAGMHGVVKAKACFDEKELEDFTRAADAMLLPYSEALGIHMQDSSFLDKPVWDLSATPKEKQPLLLHYHPLQLYRYQVCKQADTVLAHFLFEDGISENTLRRSYNYYEKITTHDSSLSSCVFGIMASRLGFSEKAYRYFRDTVRADLDNVHGNTKDGLHTASLGGAWLALVCGFAGLRLRADGLHFRFTLPKQWEGYGFRIRYHSSLLHISVKRRAMEIELEEGEAITVFVDGRQYRLDKLLTFEGVSEVE